MKASNFFLPLHKDVNEVSIATKLMIKSGMIQKLASGLYSWLPLGYKLLSKIEKIVSDEFEDIGFNRMCLPTLHPVSLWKESERYDAYGKEMLRVLDRKQNEFVYGPTSEEACVDMVRQGNVSKNDLPINIFNIQWKFRDELRPRFGVVRCREFLMCDGYSYHTAEDESQKFYKKVFDGYIKIFQKLGLNVHTQEAETGEVGGSLSHEFIIHSDIGEDIVEIDGKETKTLELGHIFLLGDKYTCPMKLNITNSENKQIPLQMGCYGIGISRLVAALIEHYQENEVISWPTHLAPFKIHIINAAYKNEKCTKISDELHDQYGQDAFYDDRNISVGQKLAASDLIGAPVKIIVWPKELDSNKVEIRYNNKSEKIQVQDITKFISDNCNI